MNQDASPINSVAFVSLGCPKILVGSDRYDLVAQPSAELETRFNLPVVAG